MRQIVSIFESSLAKRFADYLQSIGISCTIDQGSDGFRIWVHHDDQVATAKAEIPDFLADPHNERYRRPAALKVDRIRDHAVKQPALRGQVVMLKDKWNRSTTTPYAITFLLIGVSFGVAIFLGFMPKPHDQRFDQLWFSTTGSMKQIVSGEVWRLVTPIFLHADMMHLIFNMLMVYQLGMLTESRVGSIKFFSMVLAIAVLSNTAQFLYSKHLFGGMSGVNYGLFGYCWIKGKIDPSREPQLNPQAVTMMLVWFVLCLINVIPNVANWVHGVGLATGVVIAIGGTALKRIMKN